MTDMWKRANEIIPGGNHLFSKTPDRYCPGQWPPYYSYAKGIEVMDHYGKMYKDFSVMGAGNSTLGYGDPDVDMAVHNAISCGNVSTLNCVEELDLAEKILEMNPLMDMVRFGRSGNDACQIALRITREYSGKQKFAVCGYHGWEVGHPPQMDPNCTPFPYGDIGEAYNVIRDDIGAVIMEVVRTQPLDVEFVGAVRDITYDMDIPLIFDEVASGFRYNLGGIHQAMHIYPDVVTYGKAMGNGYAISAVLGDENVMKAALNTFISSMQWSERLGNVAGIATLNKMELVDSPKIITSNGRAAKEMWKYAAKHAGLDIKVSGMDALATFEFVDDTDRVLITTFTQEMLKEGYLAGGQFYPSICHTGEEIQMYGDIVMSVFEEIAMGEVMLEGEPSRPGFKRLA